MFRSQMYGQLLNTNELTSKQTTCRNVKEMGRKVDYERLKRLSKPKFINDAMKTQLTIKLKTKAKKTTTKTSSTTLCHPIELKTSKNDRQTLSAKQLASVERLYKSKKNVKRINDVLEINRNPVNKEIKSEFRHTTSKQSTRNINENLFDETILIQDDRKRCSAGIISTRNIDVNLLDKSILIQADGKRCSAGEISTATETSKMDENLDEYNKDCYEWTEQMSEQYNEDFLRSDDNNKGNDMVKIFLDSDKQIKLAGRRSVPDDENILERMAVVKDDLLTVEHSKPTSDLIVIISSMQKLLNVSSKQICPSQTIIPAWEVIWFLVIFTVLMLNIKHEILLRRPTKNDSFLEKFPDCDAVDRRIPPKWLMRDKKLQSLKRDRNNEGMSRQKVIGETTFAFNAAQCKDILQYCRVHGLDRIDGKRSTAKNNLTKSEFGSKTATQNTKVIYQKHIISKSNATRNMNDHVKATTRNNSTVTLLMISKRRQNACMRRVNPSRAETFIAGENLDKVCRSFVVWIKRMLKERQKSYRKIVTNSSNDIAFESTEVYAIYLLDKLDGLKLEIRYCYEEASHQIVAERRRLYSSSADAVSQNMDIAGQSAMNFTTVKKSNHGLQCAVRRS